MSMPCVTRGPEKPLSVRRWEVKVCRLCQGCCEDDVSIASIYLGIYNINSTIAPSCGFLIFKYI